jgi:hypothetical protein
MTRTCCPGRLKHSLQGIQKGILHGILTLLLGSTRRRNDGGFSGNRANTVSIRPCPQNTDSTFSPADQ